MANKGRHRRSGQDRVFTVNLGEENEMNLSIVRNNGNQNERNEIEELSEQVSISVGLVQQLQILSEGRNGSKDHLIQFDDSLDVAHRRRAYSHGLGHCQGFCTSRFFGSYNPDVFVEWLNTIESFFNYYDVPKGKRVSWCLKFSKVVPLICGNN